MQVVLGCLGKRYRIAHSAPGHDERRQPVDGMSATFDRAGNSNINENGDRQCEAPPEGFMRNEAPSARYRRLAASAIGVCTIAPASGAR
jgi:hypothetical protein